MTEQEKQEAVSVINRVAEFINVAVNQTHPAYQKQAAAERDAILNWLQRKLIGVSPETQALVAEAKAAAGKAAAGTPAAEKPAKGGGKLKKV